MRNALILCFLYSTVMPTPLARAAVRHRHVPPAEAPPRQPLTLTVSLERGWDVEMELHFRAVGAETWQTTPFGRSEEKIYTANIPADQVEPPGLEYFITSHEAGKPDSFIFASLHNPHRIRVEEASAVRLRQRILRHHHGRRAGVRLVGDWANYGGHPAPYYLRFEVSASYLLLALPLKSLRFGFTHERGTKIFVESDGVEMLDTAQSWASWFELGLASRDTLELDVGAAFVIGGPKGFNGGGRGELRIGVERGTHIALGAEYIPDIQFVGHFRLAWATVPGFPMAASVEVSTYPGEDEQYGVRLIYDLTRTLDNGLMGGLRISYQARPTDGASGNEFGRLTGGANLGYEF